MSRVDELQRVYPNVPRDIIIARDIHRHGIRPTEVLDRICGYGRGGIGGLYQSRDVGVTLQDLAKKNPGSAKSGLVLATPLPYFKSGLSGRIIRNQMSSYEFGEVGPGQYALYEGEEKVEDIYFPTAENWSKDLEKEPRTSRGTPVTSLVNIRRRCFNVIPVRHCEYFNTGDQCKFCNLNATYEDAAKAGGFQHNATINLEDTIEAYRIITSMMPPLVEGRLVMGGFADSDLEARIHLKFIEELARATTYLPNNSISTQPMSRPMMQRLKDAGISSISMNIEVWDRQLFEEVCPGKALNRGYDRYLEAFHNAVDIFGWGSVGTNQPGGVTLMPENGHLTWQEARDSQIEGIRWQIKNGVFPMLETLVLGVGSIYGDDPANQAKLPPTDYYLDIAIAHHEACKEFDMYQRMNRLLYCPLDCPPFAYCGQLGMVEEAGDVGKWAATCVPDDANWIARFMESFEASTKAP
ncbi:MAG: hypothetical protein Q7O66_06045 [Dehalococcoidia bacterium]|nr:hypothetical protein [Dehalococcoidia bacterium]